MKMGTIVRRSVMIGQPTARANLAAKTMTMRLHVMPQLGAGWLVSYPAGIVAHSGNSEKPYRLARKLRCATLLLGQLTLVGQLTAGLRGGGPSREEHGSVRAPPLPYLASRCQRRRLPSNRSASHKRSPQRASSARGSCCSARQAARHGGRTLSRRSMSSALVAGSDARPTLRHFRRRPSSTRRGLDAPRRWRRGCGARIVTSTRLGKRLALASVRGI
jgi:hypothetical protein